jgi:diaminohydroxyphosphoribosylaminopyrimidine deaminase/5-amino-6-(5-phosphoribosylamino)uracil reductase
LREAVVDAPRVRGSQDQRDGYFLRRALALAGKGRGKVAPNPLVGALVVRDGQVLAEGFHRRLGGLHGEADALARLDPGAARGATLYVNLEPCAHHGRTPPCADAVIAAGIARVVCCHRDPNPLVGGQGLARLRAAGIEVACGLLVEEALRINLAFAINHLLARPAITLKWAMSLDGRIATRAGDSQWISSPAGRRFALELREEHDAIVVGSQTVLADDPRLDRRLGRASEPNLRVVLDRRLRTPPEARLFAVPGPVLLYTVPRSSEVARQALAAAGAEIAELPHGTPLEVVGDLHRRGVQSLLIEGGAEVSGAFFDAGLFDRVVALLGPVLIGGRTAPGPVGGEGAATLAAACRLEHTSARRRGADWVLEGVRAGCLQDLSSSVVG